MSAFNFIALGVALLPLISCQPPYTDPPVEPLCPTMGKMDKYIIEDNVVRNLNRNARYLVLSGKQNNGPNGQMLPKAKYMNNLRWACKLEKQAITLLGTKCGYDEPKAPNGTTGVFFKCSNLVLIAHYNAEKCKKICQNRGCAKYVAATVYEELKRFPFFAIGHMTKCSAITAASQNTAHLVYRPHHI
ncbi:hypothetical protein Y032_0045g1145 [Ancylostoma ceylanicum]|nr:hypothetical protein Y032_0045g1145 [Ancylostoma ceylanicum]